MEKAKERVKAIEKMRERDGQRDTEKEIKRTPAKSHGSQ